MLTNMNIWQQPGVLHEWRQLAVSSDGFLVRLMGLVILSQTAMYTSSVMYNVQFKFFVSKKVNLLTLFSLTITATPNCIGSCFVCVHVYCYDKVDRNICQFLLLLLLVAYQQQYYQQHTTTTHQLILFIVHVVRFRFGALDRIYAYCIMQDMVMLCYVMLMKCKGMVNEEQSMVNEEQSVG